MKIINRCAITIYFTHEFLVWLKKEDPELCHLKLNELNHHPNIYTVDFEDQNLWGDCFEKFHETICRNELTEHNHLGVQWPEVSLELYRKWFRFEYHEYVYDLSGNEIHVLDE